ncbi:MAG: DUF4055 domain-containing protein [Citrobacter braakii]
MIQSVTTNYELEHPRFTELFPIYLRNEALYNGGQDVDGPQAARTFLTQHQLEKDTAFAQRVNRAAYLNFAAPTVDLFASSVTDGVDRADIKNVTEFQPIIANCDGSGGSPDAFFNSVVSKAAGVGASFVQVDLPPAIGQASRMDDAKAQGLLPYFVHVPAANIIAWDYSPDGSLEWAVRRDYRVESLGPFSKFVVVKIITLLRKNGWVRYESRDNASFEHVDTVVHNLGIVPLVPFLYEEDTPMTGKSVIDDVASNIVRVFKQDSEYDKMLFDAAVPVLAVTGLQEMDDESIVRASNYLWGFSGPDVKLQYVEPSGAAFSAKRQQILDNIDAIREISLRQTKPKGSGVESAEAKRLDSVQISSQLASFARSAAAAEKRCWMIAGKYLGVSDSSLNDLVIQYNETFDPDTVRESLTTRYMEMRRNGDLSRETLWKQLGWTDDEITAEKERLAAERKEDTAATLPDFGSYGTEAPA